jgi:ribosomal protein S2
MKIKKILKYRNKLLKLKLIKTKTYTKKQYYNNLQLEDIQYRLKKILYIIYKYHIYNKKILFIGAPIMLNFYINTVIKTTQHIFIPSSIWVKGVLSNKKKLYLKNWLNPEKNSKNKISELLLQLQKNIDLILIFDEYNNQSILNEGYISKIPVISLNSDLNIIFNKPSYKVPGNFECMVKKIRDNLFYSMLGTTLKKGQKDKPLFYSTKSKFFYKNNKQKKISKK